METLMAMSVTVIAAIMVLGLIFLIPVLLQVRRTAKEAEKLIYRFGPRPGGSYQPRHRFDFSRCSEYRTIYSSAGRPS